MRAIIDACHLLLQASFAFIGQQPLPAYYIMSLCDSRHKCTGLAKAGATTSGKGIFGRGAVSCLWGLCSVAAHRSWVRHSVRLQQWRHQDLLQGWCRLCRPKSRAIGWRKIPLGMLSRLVSSHLIPSLNTIMICQKSVTRFQLNVPLTSV